jgi:hypothetical protein
MDIANNIPPNKILIIICENREKRKMIHNYLERENKDIKKKSLQSKVVSDEIDFYYRECEECDRKMIRLENYHHGLMENNKDEYMTGECLNCGWDVNWECNYDCGSKIIQKPRNNTIAAGQYMSNKKKMGLSLPVADFSLEGEEYYLIDTPTKQLNKKKLQEYIDDILSKMI